MKRFPITALLCCLLAILMPDAYSQSVPCPANIDFELGNFTNWQLYTGTCCPINTPTLSGAVAGRHTITSGTTNDPYGGFPIVSPGGSYSLKLGNNSVSAQAERAKYFVHVPSGINDYSLIFRYAVVFQDPSHAAINQPRFEVKAYDSITNAIVNCSQYTYVATSSLPGFTLSSIGSNVWYKGWTTASIDLSGYAGRTVVVDFASGDCALGAHFGYGYIDLDCGLFKINTTACNTSAFTTLSAPPGFQSYIWKDSTLTTTLGTGQTTSIPTPSTTTKYAVILIPYTGYGCPDTLFTTVTVSNINVNANDTSLCIGSSAQLHANASGTGTPYTYSWTPSTGLSCTNCANPNTNTTINRTYYLTVTNSDGCIKQDTVNVTVSNLSLSVTKQNISCFGSANGNMSVIASGGISPYTYLWNTTPVQTASTATGLNTGTYSVTVTDNIGCTKIASDTITQPTVLTITKGTTVHVSCFGGTNGSASIIASGGTQPYTYNWNTIPARTTASITGVSAGTYTVTVTDSKGCTAFDTIVITQPSLLVSATSKTDATCYNTSNGTASVTTAGGTTPYSYTWNTTPVQSTTTVSDLYRGTYIVTTTDAKGCSDIDTVTINQPSQLTIADSQRNLKCYGDNNGLSVVTPSGGTPPYNYSWNTSPVQTTAIATNLVAGIYIATITDNKGCITKDTVTITQPNKLTSSISKTDISCYGGNNGTAMVNISGGTAPYTYRWNTSPMQTTPYAYNLSIGSYIVTITDTNSCFIYDTVIINQPTALALSKSKTEVSCFGGNNGTATISVTGGTSPYSYSWNTLPAQTTPIATGLTAGVYYVSVADNNGCIKTDSVIITEPTPLMSSTSHTNTSCYNGNNGTATVIAVGGTPPYSYSWNTNPVQTSNTATGLSANQYIVTITDNHGCIRNDTVIISQPSPVTTSLTKSDVNCYSGTNGTATIVASGGVQPYSYYWNTNPVQTSATAIGLTAGNYVVTTTDGNGCSKADTINITQPPLLTTTPGKTNISCYGGANGTASIVANGGTTPYSFAWNTSPVQTNSTATGLTAGTYIVRTTDAKGCMLYDTITLTQPTPLSSVKSHTDVSCFAGTNGTATVTIIGGTIPYIYSWNTFPVQTTNTAITLSAGNYILTTTDNNGCIKHDTVSINQPALLVSATTKNDLKCYNDSSGTLSVSATGGTAPYTYNWNTNPVSVTSFINNLNAGTYTVIITDNKGCTDTNTTTLYQPLPLSSATSHVDVKCHEGKDGETTVNVSGGTKPYSYLWNTSPVSVKSNATKLAAGTYTVTITDSNGCTIIDSTTVSEPTLLTLQSKETSKTCIGFANGSASAIAGGGTAPYSYFWNTTIPQTGTNAQNLLNDTYIVTVTDANGCEQSDTVEIYNYPKPKIYINRDSVICQGESAILKAYGTPFIIWSPTSTLSCGNCSITVARPKITTQYMAIGIDSNNCEDTAYVKLEVIPKKQVNVGPPLDICIGSPARLSAEGGISYVWTPNTALDNPYSSNPQTFTDTDMTYSVVITENECFKDTLQQSVRVHPIPTIELGPDLKGTPGSTIQLKADVTVANKIAWNPPTGLNCYDCFNPVASLSKTITYTARVYTDYCEATDDITIRVACDEALFFIPNTFTPNNDGSNDRFYPSASGVSNIDIFRVYNRWGEKVYEARNFPPNKAEYGWDGKFRNEPQWPDVFVYFIESRCANGEKVFMKGDISLIR